MSNVTYIPISANSGSVPVGTITETEQQEDGAHRQVVKVGNFPTTYPVTDNGGSLTVDGSVSVSASALPLPTGAATSAKQDDLLTELQRKADLTETQPVSAASLPLPSGAATSANQTNGNQKAQIVQTVTADANNSSTTNLGTPAYTFTGTASSTLGVAGIQVSLFADKNCQVYVDQSPDGDNWDIVDSYTYLASATNFGVTVQAINSYVRVRVTTNSETTTKFRLQTALCPIVEAVPRSLDENGNFRIANPMDGYGFEVENTPMGEMRTVEPVRLVGATFEGTTIDAQFWTTAATGTSAAIAQASAQILITSGTSSGATVTMFSNRRARYVGGASMRYRAVVQAEAGTANNVRRWGIGWGSTAMPTVTDGAWFQLNGTSFQLVTMKGGSATTITSFNGHLGATYDPGTTVKTYEIYWMNSRVYFVVGGDLLHYVSASSATWANTMNFHAFADSVNSDVATSKTLAIRTATIYRLGKITNQPQYYYHAAGTTTGVNLKLGPGNLHSMIINNVVNNSVITLSDSTSGTTPAIFVHTAGATATGVVSVDFKGVPFSNGLRLTVATQNASVTVIYE